MKFNINESIADVFNNKIILVTGGTGSIGSEIVRQLMNYSPKQIRIFSRDETKHFFLEKELEKKNSLIDIRYFIGDIRDRERLYRAFRNVDIVFHTAALKHVPFCEYNPFEAVKTNVYGTENLINAAIDYEVEKVIAISTDKAVYPNTLMGVTKLLMEKMVIGSKPYIGQAKTKFCVVRFGNVLNSRGSIIPLWMSQIQAGESVTVTDKNMKRYFITLPEAIKLVFNACAVMLGEEIFVLKMKEKNIYKMAKELIKRNSNNKNIKIKLIGAREKEKLSEKLYTDEEKQYMVDAGKYYVILQNKKMYNERMKYYITYSNLFF